MKRIVEVKGFPYHLSRPNHLLIWDSETDECYFVDQNGDKYATVYGYGFKEFEIRIHKEFMSDRGVGNAWEEA
jgi:hypothetical protein